MSSSIRLDRPAELLNTRPDSRYGEYRTYLMLLGSILYQQIKALADSTTKLEAYTFYRGAMLDLDHDPDAWRAQLTPIDSPLEEEFANIGREGLVDYILKHERVVIVPKRVAEFNAETDLKQVAGWIRKYANFLPNGVYSFTDILVREGAVTNDVYHYSISREVVVNLTWDH